MAIWKVRQDDQTSKKDFEKHVSDMHISHFSSSESNAITSKKEEEYQTEQFESTLLKRMTKEEKARKRQQVLSMLWNALRLSAIGR